MTEAINELYRVILSRKENAEEGSYTGYLFEQGLDKILKKCGEECSEVIIAAKSLQANENKAFEGSDEVTDLVNEISDLIYHLLVLMVDRDILLEDVESVLKARSTKTGNLKPRKITDKNT
jgi:phosphoribosyl-ATP pyrophosphohydrolase